MAVQMKAPTKENIIQSSTPVLYPYLYLRIPDLGGVTCQATGSMGSGKTNAIIRTAIKLFETKELHGEELESRIRNPEVEDSPPITHAMLDRVTEEKIFWRGQVSCQWDRLPGDIEKILWIQEPLEMEFEADEGTLTEEKRHFKHIPELVDRADPLKLNVVYTKNAVNFIDLIKYLVNRDDYTSWSSVFVDEWEDIAPLNMPKPYNSYVSQLKNTLKEARKRRVSFYGTTQQASGIDWRVKNKVMYFIFLMGATPPKDSRVWKRAIDKLKRGEAYCTNKSMFERLSFKNYPPRRRVNVKKGMPDYWSLEGMMAEVEAD